MQHYYKLTNIAFMVDCVQCTLCMINKYEDVDGLGKNNDDDVDGPGDQGWMICLPGNRALEACHIATHTLTQ